MAKRYQMSARNSAKSFTRNAMRVHGKNNFNPMRGGIRL